MRKLIAAAFSFVFCAAADAAPTAGIYFFEDETETFSPCPSNRTYWVTGSEKVHGVLRSEAVAAKEPIRGAVYVRVNGRYAGSSKNSESYARDYDGYFEITKVFSIRPAKKTDCRILR
jgi:hypothetical protein